MPGRPIGACPPVLSGVATLARLPMSLELATVLATVSVAGPCEVSGKCSMFSFVNSSLEGVRVSSGAVPSSLSLVALDESSATTGASSIASSGTGSCSASTTGSCATSGTDGSTGAGAGSSGGGAGFATGLGTTGLGMGANMLAQVLAAGAAGLGGSGFAAAGASTGFGCASSFASLVVAGRFHAFDSAVGTEVGSAAAPVRVPFVAAAPPRLPRYPPRPRSVPRPRPRTLSPPRARPLAPRGGRVESVAVVVSLTFERERSLAFLTSANCETWPGRRVSKGSGRAGGGAGRRRVESGALTLCDLFDGGCKVAVRVL